MREIEYLDLEDILYIHDTMLSEYGGRAGIKEPGRLENILDMPRSELFGTPQFPTVFDKAAAYLFYLSTGHCFVDANKRTGFASASVFLEINGFDFIADDEEVYEFVIYVVESNQRKEEWERRYSYKDSDELISEIALWLENHCAEIHDI